MNESRHSNQEEIVEALSHKYNYEDFLKMQENNESISVTADDIMSAEQNRVFITKHSPNPFGKRIIIDFFVLIAVIVISVVLHGVLENKKIAEYISFIGIGLIAMELAANITRYFQFNKLKKK